MDDFMCGGITGRIGDFFHQEICGDGRFWDVPACQGWALHGKAGYDDARGGSGTVEGDTFDDGACDDFPGVVRGDGVGGWCGGVGCGVAFGRASRVDLGVVVVGWVGVGDRVQCVSDFAGGEGGGSAVLEHEFADGVEGCVAVDHCGWVFGFVVCEVAHAEWGFVGGVHVGFALRVGVVGDPGVCAEVDGLVGVVVCGAGGFVVGGGGRGL